MESDNITTAPPLPPPKQQTQANTKPTIKPSPHKKTTKQTTHIKQTKKPHQNKE